MRGRSPNQNHLGRGGALGRGMPVPGRWPCQSRYAEKGAQEVSSADADWCQGRCFCLPLALLLSAEEGGLAG